MVDPDDSLEDDEYYFSEMGMAPGAGSQQTGGTGSPGNIYGTSIRNTGADRFSRKNILIVVGVVLVAFIGYKLAGVFIQTHKNKSKQVDTQQTVKPTPPKQVQMPTPAPTQAPVQHHGISAAESKMLADRFEKLHSLNQANIHDVQSKFGMLQQGLMTVREDAAKNTELLQEISDQLAYQQAELTKLIQSHKKPKKKKPRTKVMAAPPTNYAVKAVVPGRAWLQNQSNNKTVTVSVGDELGSYGWVKNIDLGRGLVFMSSGKVFAFAPDDR